jgi:DNA mismatch repair protein MutS
MELDINTRRNLELCETMRAKEKRGSLLWVLDHTKTAMGSRLLRTWIEMPLRSVNDIVKRQKTVTELANDYMLREELGELLKGVLDIERLMSRIVYQSANAKDLRALFNTLQIVKPLKDLLMQGENPQLQSIAQSLDTMDDLIDLIDRAIVDEPPFSIREGGMIRAGYHQTVDQLNEMIHNSKSFLEKIEAQEREATGIKNLKISYNRVFGYYIEITKSNLDQVPEHYIRKQTLTTGERYITQELKELEAAILGATDKITSLEYELFVDLRSRVAEQAKRIQQNGDLLAMLDVYYSLATVAQQQNYVCPEVDNSDVISIKDGRHPVVERFVQDQYFVPNDTELNTENRRLMLITGPNMAGKSTYMRQTALITLMAQIGSFVPAKEARIGVVDKLFTRVGASDDLASGQSTFMLEMNEVAYILKNATKQSLIIYDEIGRGTSTFDGMSIAQAVAEYTAGKAIGAKTLFATHYHELTDLEKTCKGVMNYHIAAKKKGDDIIFLRKIIEGAADDSYGIEVAKLAGVPNEVVNKAKNILAHLISQGPLTPKKGVEQSTTVQDEITFEILAQQDLIAKIKKTDINQLTPLEALNLVYEWKQKAQTLP